MQASQHSKTITSFVQLTEAVTKHVKGDKDSRSLVDFIIKPPHLRGHLHFQSLLYNFRYLNKPIRLILHGSRLLAHPVRLFGYITEKCQDSTKMWKKYRAGWSQWN